VSPFFTPAGLRIRLLWVFNKRSVTTPPQAQYDEADFACDEGDSKSNLAACCGLRPLNRHIFLARASNKNTRFVSRNFTVLIAV
jgi:hypothetical protein